MKRCAILLSLLWLATAATCSPSESKQRDATPPAGCELGEFDCGTGDECIDYEKVCDEAEDCSNGADEHDCGCGAGLYACDDGQCIHAAFVCDNVHNCIDGSDEQGCP